MKIQTDADFYKSDGVNYQRSSAIKSYETCSWMYYCNYVLKIPQSDNKGALQGNVCHSFFECLLNKRHKKHFKPITKANSVNGSPACARLVRKLIKRNKLPANDEVFNKIDSMILVGLRTDFFVKGGELMGREYRFKLKNEAPNYAIYGTIDKIAFKDEYVIIDDFKSSKLKFSGEDKESSVQALMYSLACSKLWPDKKPKVRFVFLQYPDEPHQEIEFTPEQLKGFEHYLEAMQYRFDNFTEELAYGAFAADQPIPSDGSFGGKLVCGFAKQAGQLKKDGTPMWHCPYKFGFKYYVLKQGDKIVTTARNKEELHPEEGQTIEEMNYAGCPRFRDHVGTVTENKTKFVPHKNILDNW